MAAHWCSWKRTLLVYHSYILFPDLGLFCLCLREVFLMLLLHFQHCQNTESWFTHLRVQRKVFCFATNYCLLAVLREIKDRLKNLGIEEWSNQVFEIPEQPELLLLLKERKKRAGCQVVALLQQQENFLILRFAVPQFCYRI